MRPKLLLMTRSENVYVFQEFEKDLAGVKYHFVSKGERRIVKIVEYQYIGLVGGMPTYNLGFGNYIQNENTIQDDEISANGDAYTVFHTVLSTIPNFMLNYPGALVMVAGSDSVISPNLQNQLYKKMYSPSLQKCPSKNKHL